MLVERDDRRDKGVGRGGKEVGGEGQSGEEAAIVGGEQQEREGVAVKKEEGIRIGLYLRRA